MCQGSSLYNNHYHFPKLDCKLDEPQQSRKYPYTIVDTVPKLVAALDTDLKILSEGCSPRSYHAALTSPESLSGISTQTPPDSTHEIAAPDSPCDIPSTTPILYVDSEGISLSCWGELSILEFTYQQTPSNIHISSTSTYSDTLHSIRQQLTICTL